MATTSTRPAPVEGPITPHLDLWTSAIKRKSSAGRGSSSKIELYGIKKLRELILELAVRGLLVPQDAKDEPASELLKKVSAEKARLAKEGKIKKEKPLPPIAEEEKPFALPSSWVFSRLLSISNEIGTGPFGSMIHQADYITGGTPLINPSHMNNDRIVEDENVSVGNEKALELSSYRLFPGDIVLARRGEVGRCALVTEREEGWLCGTGSFYLRLSSCISRRFIVLVFSVPSTRAYLVGNAVGTTMVNLNHGILNNLPVAIPPLAEQHRIVAKVDELMALCDQLEQQTGASLAAHQTLMETLLQALIDSGNMETSGTTVSHQRFQQAWQRIADNFDILFTTEQSIDQLKQTILQLAVMGKLVPQAPNDEPANVLLKKIAAEKSKLIMEGKIKKEKPLPPISEEEKPFALPSGWEWVRLGQVGICSTGKTPSTSEPKFFEGNIPFIGPGQISPQGKLLFSEKSVSEEGLFESMEAMPNDILMVCIGGSIGKSAIANKRLAFNQQINSIRPIYISSKYLFTTVSTDYFYNSVIRKATGSATPIINRSKWEELLVPLSPMLEQQRIITKVDELMALCDQLKDSFKLAETTQLGLTDAVVKIGGAQ